MLLNDAMFVLATHNNINGTIPFDLGLLSGLTNLSICTAHIL